MINLIQGFQIEIGGETPTFLKNLNSPDVEVRRKQEKELLGDKYQEAIEYQFKQLKELKENGILE